MRLPTLDEGWEALRPRLSTSRLLLACFDYDGTLTPIRPTPEEAVVDEGVKAALRELARCPRTRVAVVSGRPLEELEAMLDGSGELWLVGHHGLSRRDPREKTESRPGTSLERDETLAGLRALGRDLERRHDGVRLEDKGAMVALHTRQADRKEALLAAETFRDEASRLEGYELLGGKEVVEVRPAGIDKGRAIAVLRRELSPGGIVLYVGDDVTDEDAFRALSDDDGITVLVGDREGSAADYRVDGPEDVERLVRRLVGLRAEGPGE